MIDDRISCISIKIRTFALSGKFDVLENAKTYLRTSAELLVLLLSIALRGHMND
ncbi:MAG: hypothetical protein CLLPBCKN_004437 [Chroococcidiopsis cubana SAG 39.79]|uniref:hypothetical protein n=1 Tax=Chroococcidiopsis cubana TaxID=171392 RepID=UPI0003082300|nr:hypothetical protein [Chroococcidiopsis cubana]MDZ4875041.1 hypothetical protein [Chroococcidiopsis cubana SAG 39.79]